MVAPSGVSSIPESPLIAPDAHDPFHREDPVPHAAEKVRAARMDPCVARCEVGDGLVDRPGPHVLERRRS